MGSFEKPDESQVPRAQIHRWWFKPLKRDEKVDLLNNTTLSWHLLRIVHCHGICCGACCGSFVIQYNEGGWHRRLCYRVQSLPLKVVPQNSVCFLTVVSLEKGSSFHGPAPSACLLFFRGFALNSVSHQTRWWWSELDVDRDWFPLGSMVKAPALLKGIICWNWADGSPCSLHSPFWRETAVYISTWDTAEHLTEGSLHRACRDRNELELKSGVRGWNSWKNKMFLFFIFLERTAQLNTSVIIMSVSPWVFLPSQSLLQAVWLKSCSGSCRNVISHKSEVFLFFLSRPKVSKIC